MRKLHFSVKIRCNFFLLQEEEMFIPFSIPSPADNSPAQEVPIANMNDTSGKGHSPPSKNFCPKFIREEDLAVSLHDLENIFDTSSSEEDNVRLMCIR